jgi:multiple sugar transport system substrate-binding protein
MGSLGQGEVTQLLRYGSAVQGHAVTAAWSSFEDPTTSAVAGKLQAAVLPHPEGREPGVVIGNWHLGVPQNLPEERKQAALAFLKWFLTEGAQLAYAEAGAIPVRSDVFTSDLAERPEHRWMEAYLDSMPHAQQVLGFAEAAAVEEALGLRLNEALIGEMSSAAALNAAATDIAAIFEQSGRNTGTLAPLPE